MREELMRIAEKAGDLRYDRSTAVLATSAVVNADATALFMKHVFGGN